jgi:hypothetical protein
VQQCELSLVSCYCTAADFLDVCLEPLQKTQQLKMLERITFALPVFLTYGHEAPCQVQIYGVDTDFKFFFALLLFLKITSR